MHIETRFRRSMYITLGLACACLGYAELAFLPEMSVFVAVIAILLFVAYRLEGRWALSIRAANILGGVIGLGGIGWVGFQFFRPWGGTLLDQLPWPTSLLPYLGPLLMILIPAKLFRPKHNGDFWGLQGVGLIAVALGCALAGDILFGALMLAYLTSATWSLTLFYYYREQERAGTERATSRRPHTAPSALRQAGRWAVVVSTLALLMFLGTPRSSEARWELSLSGNRFFTGFDENRPEIDLNHSGTLKVNRDLVSEVRAFTRDGQPKTDLDAGIRWRGATFNYYDHGRWENRPRFDENRRGLSRGFDPIHPPFGTFPKPEADQFYLEYYPHPKGGHSSLLAEPIWRFVQPDPSIVPVASVVEGRRGQQLIPWVLPTAADGELRPDSTARTGPNPIYRQVVGPGLEPGIGPPVRGMDQNHREHLRNHQSVSQLGAWTRALLERLVREGRVPADVLKALGEDGDGRQIDEKYYEKVARALEAHLAISGEYKYSLDLKRQDTKLDPVEDFLFNIRKGHCSRYATALTLMLRTLGVPTRIVLGFRGMETDSDGLYEIRQCHAHAWVEALIRREQPGRPATWHWLTLDPTPAMEDVEAAEFQWGNFWELTRNEVSQFFRHFIVEYDADQQDRAYSIVGGIRWLSLENAARMAFFGADGDNWSRAIFLCLCGLALLYGAIRLVQWRRARRTPPADPSTAFFRRMLEMLARRLDVRPEGGQTPREFAVAAAERLQAAPALRDVGGLPTEVARLYYRVRYGGQPLDPREQQDLDGRLDRFEKALAGAGLSSG